MKNEDESVKAWTQTFVDYLQKLWLVKIWYMCLYVKGKMKIITPVICDPS